MTKKKARAWWRFENERPLTRDSQTYRAHNVGEILALVTTDFHTASTTGLTPNYRYISASPAYLLAYVSGAADFARQSLSI